MSGNASAPNLWVPESQRPVTPYELRFKILELAQRHLVTRYELGIQTKPIYGSSSGGIGGYGGGIPAPQVEPGVTYPTPDEVFELASRMRAFVDQTQPVVPTEKKKK